MKRYGISLRISAWYTGDIFCSFGQSNGEWTEECDEYGAEQNPCVLALLKYLLCKKRCNKNKSKGKIGEIQKLNEEIVEMLKDVLLNIIEIIFL